MAKFSTFILLGLTVVTLGACQEQRSSTNDLGSYATVSKTGVLNCGYVSYPPALVKDPETGALSGIFYDAVETASKNLGWKVNWKEEVQWGTMIEGLKANRYDAICSPVWSNSARWAQADFSTPLYFSGVFPYVKEGDRRFDSDLAIANSPSYKISTIDGDTSEAIATQLFPKASLVSLPQLSDYSQIILAVRDGKADLTFAEPYFVAQFSNSNGGGVEAPLNSKPLRVFGNSMMFRKGDDALRSTMDGALAELVNDGTVTKLVEKHTGSANTYLPVARPYEEGRK